MWSQNTLKNKTKQNIHLHTQIDNEDHYCAHLRHREDTQTENNTLKVRVKAGDGMKEGKCQTYRKRNCTLLKRIRPRVNFAYFSVLKLDDYLFLYSPPSFSSILLFRLLP